MKELIKKIHAEVLDEHKRRHPGVPESLHEAGARQMADLVVSGVLQTLANPPVGKVKPAEARQLPSGLSPERIARLQKIVEDSARHAATSKGEVIAILRRNIEERVKKFFEGTGISYVTMNAFIEAAKGKAGW